MYIWSKCTNVGGMKFEVDPDVAAVAEFMQARIPASRLRGVAEELAMIAPVLWKANEREPVKALSLVHDVIPRTPVAATG